MESGFDMDRKIFLNNASLIEEINKSKLTYCCYIKGEGYEKYTYSFDSFDLITPGIFEYYFNCPSDNNYVIIRVYTTEHLPDGYRTEHALSSCMAGYKHFLLFKKDFDYVNENFKVDREKVSSIEGNIMELEDEKHELEKRKKELSAIKVRSNDKEEFEDIKREIKKYEEKINEYQTELKSELSKFCINLRPKLIEVLRSHYKGETIETSVYDPHSGKLTYKLCRMLELLADRYIKSGNWSRYTYTDDMVSSAVLRLVEKVLSFDENKSSNCFGLLTQIAKNEFRIVLNKEKEQRCIKSDMMVNNGYNPSYTEQYKDQDIQKFGEYI